MIKKETSFIDLKQVKIDDPFFSRVQNVVIHTMLPYRNGCFTMRCPESERAM